MIKNSIIKNFCLAFSLLPVFLASNDLDSATKQVNKPVFRQVSTELGLSQNSVNGFYEDSDGFVWLSTDAGVNQFDGNQMIDNTSINEQYKLLPLNAFAKDEKGRFWLAGNDGLVIANPGTNQNKRIKFPSSQRRQSHANAVLGIETLDAQSTLVFSRNGVYQVNVQTNDISQPISMQQFLLKSDALLSFAQNEEGYWLGSNNGLYFFNSKSDSIYELNLPKAISKVGSIVQISENNLLVADNEILWQLTLNKSAGPVIEVTKVKKIAKVKITSSSQSREKIFYSTDSEIYQFDRKSNQLEKLFSIADSLSNKDRYRIRSLFLDSRNLLWIGTESQGAFIWNSNISAFKGWEDESPSNANEQLIWKIIQDKQQKYWIASGSELKTIDKGKNYLKSVIELETLENSNVQIYSILPLEGYLWLATNQGLYQYDKASNKALQYFAEKNGTPVSQSFYSITSSDNNTLWLAGTGGLVKYDISLESFFYLKAIMPEYDAQKIRHVSFQNGKLWVDLPEQIVSYDIEKNSVNKVLPIKRDKLGQLYPMTDLKLYDNNLWISFKGDGIYLLKFDEASANYRVVRHFHTSSGFYDNHIYSIEENDGFIWATSTQGVIKINATKFGTEIFSSKHGVISNEFNEAASLVGSDGNLYFGSIQGLTSINPNLVEQETTSQETFIYSVKGMSSGKEVSLPISNSSIELTSDIDSLQIEFTTFDYMNNRYHNIDYWIGDNTPKKVLRSAGLRIQLAGIGEGEHLLNIRTYAGTTPAQSNIKQLKINVVSETEHSSLWTKQQSYFLTLLILALTIFALTWSRWKLKRKVLTYIDEGVRNRGGELTLKDVYQGTWECVIKPDDYLGSKLTIYHNQRKPIELSLGEYLGLIEPDRTKSVSIAWKNLLLGQTETIHQTYQVQLYNGWHWNKITGEICSINSKGNPSLVAGSWSDITREKENEKHLKLYSSAFQSTQDIVFILSINFDIIDVNQSYQNTTGFSSAPLIGKNLIQLASNRVSVDYLSKMKSFILDNKKWRGEGTLPRRNAPSLAVNILANTIIDGDIENGYIFVMTDIKQTKNVDKSMNNASFYDQVTGLPNKAIAFDKLRELLEKSEKGNKLLSIIFLSIEPYKTLKAELKKSVIDSLLLTTSNRILPYVQADDLLARYEENIFILLLKGNENDKSIPHTINQILGEIAKPFEIENQMIEISACAGISSFPNDGSSWSELITKSETALAQTKQQGSNLFKYYHEESNLVAKERVKLESKLKSAIESGELFLVFQPILNLNDMRIVELDANIRWKSGESKIIYPNHFLRIAERIGLRKEFDCWYIEKSLACLKRWHQEGLKYCINLNLTLGFLTEEKYFSVVERAILDNEIEPKWVYVSLMEDELIQNIKSFQTISKKLNALGVGLVLDGFGSNATPFKLLENLGLHSVKLTRRLTREISRSKFNDLLLSGTISLLNNLEIGSVAKGIEEENQLNFLKQSQCQYGQGFIFSDPLNENQTRQYLLNSKQV